MVIKNHINFLILIYKYFVSIQSLLMPNTPIQCNRFLLNTLVYLFTLYTGEDNFSNTINASIFALLGLFFFFICNLMPFS